MCFFCGCGGGGIFKSVQVILPSETTPLAEGEKKISRQPESGKGLARPSK